MTINPAPSVSIASTVPIDTCTHTGPTGLPALSATAPTVLGDLVVRWGRADSWETPPPAVLDLELFDPAEYIMSRVADMSILGLAVSVTIPAGTGTRRLFYGRVANVSASETVVATTTGDRTGWRIQITASDWRGVLAERGLAYDWPGDSYSTRANRIAGVIPWDLMTPDETWIPHVLVDYLKAVNGVSSPDAALENLAATTGDHHQYNPDTDQVEIIATALPGAAVTGHPATPPASLAETAAGAVTIRAAAARHRYQVGGLVRTWPGTTLPGDAVARTVGQDVTAARADRTGRWTVTYGDDGQATATDWTQPQPSPAVAYATDLDEAPDAQRVAAELQRRGTTEARGPHHPPIEYRTDAAGGFDSWTQALAVLKTWETPQPIAVTGSAWTRATGAVLVHTVIGGEVRYRRGDWRVLMRLRRTLPTPGPGPTWSALAAAGIEWGRPPATARRFHPSVVWADLAAGVTSATVHPAEE